MFLLLKIPRTEAVRVPLALRPALRQRPDRGNAWLTLSFEDWAEEAPPPPIPLNDMDRGSLSWHRSLDDIDVVIAKDWGIDVGVFQGGRPRKPETIGRKK